MAMIGEYWIVAVSFGTVWLLFAVARIILSRFHEEHGPETIFKLEKFYIEEIAESKAFTRQLLWMGVISLILGFVLLLY